MPTISTELEIDAPQAALFALSQDYRLRLRWDPFVKEIVFRDGTQESAVGALPPRSQP